MVGLKAIFEFTYLGQIVSKYKSAKNLKVLSSVNLSYIEAYWAKKGFANIHSKSKILVDGLIFHPSYNEKNFLTAKLVHNIKGGKLVSLVQYNSSNDVIELSRKFGIGQHLSVYRLFSTIDMLRSFIWAIRIKGGGKFSVESGYKMIISNVDVSDLIYDEYLRRNNLHTMRKVSLDFLLFAARSHYLFLRYKKILVKQEISDIVIGHNVYAYWGMLIFAASAIGRNITVWNWINYGEEHLSIIHYSACYPIIKPNYLDNAVLDSVTRHLIESDIDVNVIFKKLVAKKYAGYYVDRDSSNVYTGVKVDSVAKFHMLYPPDSEKYSVLVFSHSFVDAVNYARWSVFADYFTWLEETLKFLVVERVDCNVYVKAHPSEDGYPCKVKTKDVVERINKSYGSNVVLLNSDFDNRVLFDIADVVLTCNGSVSVEAPAFGTKVIAAGECFTDNCGGVIQSKSMSGYFANLINFQEINLSHDVIKRSRIGFIWFHLMTRVSLPLTVEAHDYELKDDILQNSLNIITNKYLENREFAIETSVIIELLKQSIKAREVNLFNKYSLNELD